MKRQFNIKEPDVSLEELQYLEPALGIVFYYFIMYANLYGLPVTITSISERVPGRISSTHDEFRAIDLSVKNWDLLHIKRVERRLNEVYRHWGTSAKVEGKKKVAVYHDAGRGAHLHLQVRRNIKLEL